MAENVVVRILANLDDNASAGLRNIEGEVRDVDSALQRSDQSARGFLGRLGGVAGIATAGAAAVTGVGAAVVATTGAYLQNTRELTLNARATGVNVRQLSRLQYAFQRTGSDGTDVRSILTEIGIKLGDARDGVEDVDRAFGQLGLRWQDLIELSPDQSLQIIVERLQTIDNLAIRANIADRIFGGDDAQKILALGDNLGVLTDQADRFGITIDEKSAAAAERFNQNISALGGVVEGAGNQIAQAVIERVNPAIEQFGRAFGILPGEAEGAIADMIQRIENQQAFLEARGVSSGEAFARGFVSSLDGLGNDIITKIRTGITGAETAISGGELSDEQAGILRGVIDLAATLGLIPDIRGNLAASVTRGPTPQFTRGGIEGIPAPVGGFPNVGRILRDVSAQELFYSGAGFTGLPVEGVLGSIAGYRTGRFNNPIEAPPALTGPTAQDALREIINRDATLAGRIDDLTARADEYFRIAQEAAQGGLEQLSQDYRYYGEQALEALGAQLERAREQAERLQERELSQYFSRQNVLAGRIEDNFARARRLDELAVEAFDRGLQELGEDFEYYADQAERQARQANISRGDQSQQRAPVVVNITAGNLTGDDSESLARQVTGLVSHGLTNLRPQRFEGLFF